MSPRKKLLAYLAVSLLALFLLLLSGSQGWEIRAILVGIVYALLGLYVGRATDSRLRWLAIIVLPWFGFLMLFELLSNPIQAVPLAFVGLLAGGAGYAVAHLLRHRRAAQQVLANGLCVLTFAFIGFAAIPNWVNHVRMTTTSPPVEGVIEHAAFHTLSGTPITSASMQGRITVLDFWNSACGVCFQKFPELDALYTDYADDPMVNVYAVNLPIADETDAANFAMIEERGHVFPQLFAKDADATRERFSIVGVPIVIVLDGEGQIVHRGGLDREPYIVIGNLERAIENARAQALIASLDSPRSSHSLAAQ